MGGHDYGSNGIAVSFPDQIRLGLSDTIETPFSGAAVIDAQLSINDSRQARELHDELCAALSRRPQLEASNGEAVKLVSVDCVKDGKLVKYSASLGDLPLGLATSLQNFYLKTMDNYPAQGRAVARLDVGVESVVRQRDKFLVSIKFSNAGDYPMITTSPDRWSGRWGESLLWINGATTDGKSKWDADLSGLALVNGSDFSGDTLTILPRSSVTFKFLTVPRTKVKAGTYKVNARVFMSVGADDGPVATMGKVDFHSDYKNPTKVTIDRDYPSTPEEWKDYETRKAKEVAPVAPGASITEPGFYRAVSAWESSPFVTELKAGVTAPTTDIKFASWNWAADPARGVRCDAGQACPRDGRWVMRSVDYGHRDTRYETYAQHERRYRTGESMPAIAVSGVPDSKLFWAWLGA